MPVDPLGQTEDPSRSPRVARWLRIGASAVFAVSFITLLTRLVGFARWIVFSPTVGAGVVGTAYQSANQLPNILFEVVAGGALAGAVVPLLAKPLAAADTKTASQMASALLTWACLLTAPISVGVFIFHDVLAWSFVSAQGGDRDLAADFLVMFSPQILLYAIGAVLTGVLQAHRKFMWPAVMPLVSSVVVIGVYVLYAGISQGSENPQYSSLALLGWGTTAGVAALALPLALPTARTDIRLRPRLVFPHGMATLALRLATAGMLTLIAQQLALLVVLTVANRMGGTGVYVAFSYIQAVYMLPYGVLAVPLATIIFSRLSRMALVGLSPEVSGTLAVTTAAILRVGIWGCAVLIAAASPLEVFFSSLDAAADNPHVPFEVFGLAAAVMSLGLPGWCLIAWAQRAFSALHKANYGAVAIISGWICVAAGCLLGTWWLFSSGFVEPPTRSERGASTLLIIASSFALGMTVSALCVITLLYRVGGAAAVSGLCGRTVRAMVIGAISALSGAWAGQWLLEVSSAWPPIVAAVMSGLAAGCLALGISVTGAMLWDRRLINETLRLSRTLE